MRERIRRGIVLGIAGIAAFCVWTLLVQKVDVQPIGPGETTVGFATFNLWIHHITGVHKMLYYITDWLGLVPIAVCMMYGGVGIFQLVKRRSLLKVDLDLIVLGIYYMIVIFCYLIFEMIPINYRPVLINGVLEASYPSSTTLLVLSVMPTLSEQMNRRVKKKCVNDLVNIFAVYFSIFMVIGRLISGVHWFTDIVGSVMLSTGLFYIYKTAVLIVIDKKRK